MSFGRRSQVRLLNFSDRETRMAKPGTRPDMTDERTECCGFAQPKT
ncbi:MAG TPA: hypothetical protein VNZ94_07535 [Xanthobacteraceae bacterium]|nr:hypothetical protein [Xanthobacteraceae bacterium]